MSTTNPYKCVNCGVSAAALYKSYGPHVLKLTKCENCKGFVDKYIEYDPVIVMIDLVLMSREAQRHILYNTDFKSYWKLLIILVMLETYGVWRNDSLFNIVTNSICSIENMKNTNETTVNIEITKIDVPIPNAWREVCVMWSQEAKTDDNDLFIWEKDFYIQFTSTFAGIIIFILTVQSVMKMTSPLLSNTEVSFTRIMKAFSLADVSILLTLPMLVWGNADTSAETRTLHYALVFCYSFVLFVNVFTVLYERPVVLTTFALMAGNILKYATCFYITPHIRRYVT